jgi:hypothetical protein
VVSVYEHDAVSIGLAAIDGVGILPVARDDVTLSLRLLCVARLSTPPAASYR